MKNILLLVMAMLMWATTPLLAQTYTSYLTTDRGFTEVTTLADITGNANDYYILVSAENTGLIVGIGAYEAKPDWASTESKALHYKSAETDPILDLTNFFTIEKSGSYIGLRNVVYSADMFQTHDNAGYMYVNTYTDKNLDEWSYLIPSFQSGYWTFENGKYPFSSDNWAKGYLGPWHDSVVADDALALNKAGDAIGHFRLFRITKENLLAQQRKALADASASNHLNATWLITNPSFETGDETGWTTIGRDDPSNNEFTVRDYGMTNKDGLYLFNAYQWWGTNLGVTQTAEVPSGEYTLSGVVCTWANRVAYFTGNEATVNQTGTDDGTGIPVSLNVNVGISGKLTISAGSSGQWWVSGHDSETQTFFKLDNVQLTCKGLYLNGVAEPLPNDETTVLTPNQWYYYEAAYASEYWILGNINDMVYSTDGLELMSDISTSAVSSRSMDLSKGRHYFMTTRSDATLKVVAKRVINESTNSFKACALNVDGLPQSILLIEINPTGPGSDGTKKISTYLSNKAYDLMAFSEDFNYHSELTSQLPTSTYTWGKHRGKVTTLSNNTDGLEFACKNSTVTWTNESYVAYTSTASTDGNQYIKKGYRHYDVTFDGQTFDVYITHMDAGDNNDAITSRGKQWKQLTEDINAVDNGRTIPRPKIVMGDTNCRWTRDGVKANFLDLLSSDFTASDVWVELCRNGNYPTTNMASIGDKNDPTFANNEIVDKIFYINPKAPNTLQLVPQSFKIENDYTYEDGTTPLGDHPPLVVEFKLVKSGNEVPLTLELANAADNSKAIADMGGATANVTIAGRTLYKDGYWNTLCLPFYLSSLTGTPLEGATLMELDTEGYYDEDGNYFGTAAEGRHKTGIEGNTLYLNFKDATSITAGKPYIIKWDSGTNFTPTFNTVTIVSGSAGTIESEDGKVQFIGTYGPVGLAKDDQTNLFMDEENKLKWPNVNDYYVNAFRAYFHLNENVTPSRFVLNFGDDVPTAISNVNANPNDNRCYDLQGRQIVNGQLKHGLYIINNKKVVIK